MHSDEFITLVTSIHQDALHRQQHQGDAFPDVKAGEIWHIDRAQASLINLTGAYTMLQSLIDKPLSPKLAQVIEYQAKAIARYALYFYVFSSPNTHDVPPLGRLGDTVRSMVDLHQRKSAGYAGLQNDDPWVNFRSSTNWNVEPWRGTLVRMSDKYTRLRNLYARMDNEQVGESIWDTVLDLAAYALIFICLFREAHAKELGKQGQETLPA